MQLPPMKIYATKWIRREWSNEQRITIVCRNAFIDKHASASDTPEFIVWISLETSPRSLYFPLIDTISVPPDLSYYTADESIHTLTIMDRDVIAQKLDELMPG